MIKIRKNYYGPKVLPLPLQVSVLSLNKLRFIGCYFNITYSYNFINDIDVNNIVINETNWLHCTILTKKYNLYCKLSTCTMHTNMYIA